MDNCCVRELTVLEEIDALDIDQSIKERIKRKVDIIIDENHKQGEYLFNCHNEIDRLKRAIVSQAKVIGTLEADLRNMGIR